MILITKTNVYINMQNVTTMGILDDKKTLVINSQPIVFNTIGECTEVFDTVTTFLKTTSIYGVKDMREDKNED